MRLGSRIDDTLNTDYIALSPVNADETIRRLSEMGSILQEHEEYIFHLGVADVSILRMPYATRVRIDWNEEECPSLEYFILNSPIIAVLASQLTSTLTKYLGPSLSIDWRNDNGTEKEA